MRGIVSKRQWAKRGQRNNPDDIVMIINGQIVTVADVLEGKKRRNEKRLIWKREMTGMRFVVRPCFVWVFDNGPILPYGDTWLYVRTSRCDYRIGKDFHAWGIKEQIISQFPCGLGDDIDYTEWKDAFLRAYPKIDRKRPSRPGNAQALGWAVVLGGKLERVFADKFSAKEYASRVYP